MFTRRVAFHPYAASLASSLCHSDVGVSAGGVFCSKLVKNAMTSDTLRYCKEYSDFEKQLLQAAFARVKKRHSLTTTRAQNYLRPVIDDYHIYLEIFKHEILTGQEGVEIC